MRRVTPNQALTKWQSRLASRDQAGCEPLLVRTHRAVLAGRRLASVCDHWSAAHLPLLTAKERRACLTLSPAVWQVMFDRGVRQMRDIGTDE